MALLASLALTVPLIGAAPSQTPPLRVVVAGSDRALVVSLFRVVHDDAPFVVDTTRARVILTTRAGREVRLLPEVRGRVSSGNVPSEKYHPSDRADVRYLLGGVPAGADMYALSFDDGGGIHAADGSELHAVSETFPRSVWIPATTKRPGAPIADLDLQRLRSTYVGRTMYAVGGLVANCRSNLQIGFRPFIGARITGFSRAVGTSQTWTLGGELRNHAAETPASFISLDPVLVTVETPVTGLDAVMMQGPSDPALRGLFADPGAVAARCPQSTFLVADRWEFERLMSLRSVGDRKVTVGMDRATVAAIWGYPSVFGTVDQLKRLNDWEYEAPTPGQHSVRFVHDRVVAVTQPRQLP